MSSVSERVARLAQVHEIRVVDDHASFLACAFSRIEGIEGDATLELIAALLEGRVLTDRQANALALEHVRELRAAGGA